MTCNLCITWWHSGIILSTERTQNPDDFTRPSVLRGRPAPQWEAAAFKAHEECDPGKSFWQWSVAEGRKGAIIKKRTKITMLLFCYFYQNRVGSQPWNSPAGPKIRSHKMIKGIRKKRFYVSVSSWVFNNFWSYLVKRWLSSAPQSPRNQIKIIWRRKMLPLIELFIYCDLRNGVAVAAPFMS